LATRDAELCGRKARADAARSSELQDGVKRTRESGVYRFMKDDEPILESATMVAMDIFELFQIVGDDIVYDAYKAIDLIQIYGDLRVRKALRRQRGRVIALRMVHAVVSTLPVAPEHDHHCPPETVIRWQVKVARGGTSPPPCGTESQVTCSKRLNCRPPLR
jgi:hypothetical protein